MTTLRLFMRLLTSLLLFSLWVLLASFAVLTLMTDGQTLSCVTILPRTAPVVQPNSELRKSTLFSVPCLTRLLQQRNAQMRKP